MKLDSKVGFNFTVSLWGREKFVVDLGSHESCTRKGAPHEEKPDGPPSKSGLKRANSKETDGGSDGSASIDEASDGSKGLVVSTDRWMGCKISSNS